MIVETKSAFLNHLLLWWLSASVLSIIFLPLVFTASDFEISKSEVAFFSDLGRSTDSVTSTANSAYDVIFVRTGAAKFISWISTDSTSGFTKSGALQSGTNWSATWFEGALSMIYRMLWRVIALWPIYLSGLFAFCLPAMIDGLVVRAKKKYDFLQSNPVFFYGSAHSAALCFGLGLFIPILPMDINLPMLMFYFSAVAAALWVAAANFQTGQ